MNLIILFWGSCPLHFRIFSLYPLSSDRTHCFDNQKCLQILPNVPWGGVEEYYPWLRLTALSIIRWEESFLNQSFDVTQRQDRTITSYSDCHPHKDRKLFSPPVNLQYPYPLSTQQMCVQWRMLLIFLLYLILGFQN